MDIYLIRRIVFIVKFDDNYGKTASTEAIRDKCGSSSIVTVERHHRERTEENER